MSYLSKRGSVYYFRRVVPDDVQPAIGKREIMKSLRTKDRAEAIRLVPLEMIASEALFAQARKTVAPEAPVPPAKSMSREEWEYQEWQVEQASADLFERDMAVEELQPVMDAIEAGTVPDASPADILRAGKLLAIHLKEEAKFEQQAALSRMYARYGENRLASAEPNQAAANVSAEQGKGLYLDGDILDRWAAERGVVAKGKDTHKSVAEWFHERVGKKSVEQITRQDVLAFKDKLIAEGQTVANTNMKLSRLRTLLGWAYQNDLVPANVAQGISVKAAEGGKNKRLPFSLADLQAIFSSPVYADGERPKRGKGDTAFWLPLLALFTGARLEEIGQLRISDVQQHEYPDQDGMMLTGWFLHITGQEDEKGQANRIKNAASERLVPVHPELVRLGFLSYVEKLKDRGGRVFPLLVPNLYGRQTAKWGEWFGPYLRTVCGITDKRKVFHSFRHTFKDYMRRAEIVEAMQRQLMGHSSSDVADSYGAGYDLNSLTRAVASYRVPGLVLPEPI